MTSQQPVAKASPPGSITSSDRGGLESKTPVIDDKRPENQRMEAALGDAILRFFRIRKGPKGDEYDLDAIATQPSIWDSENVEEYKSLYIHPQWENWSAFDPNFRWTWREERETRRKVDWKIMLWACIMFAALNIDRNNISNAVSDNMLDDLNLTRGDYICLFSTISGAQFLLKGRASFLATRYLIDTILYLSYWYTGTSCPSKTKSWWNPKGYFTEKEEKIIVNSVIRDDPQKGGMYNRQGLSVKQIWECSKDYDMWPLYILGLLFGLPKYPVNQYLTLSFRGLGFNVIETNLLSIPNVVGSCLTMLIITAVSELLNNRSFVAMAEDAWLLPCFVALIALPDPISSWAYFAIATVLLSFPYDSPRYFKANTGLLVICVWMCLVQYPATYFYYNWRNKSKAKKWDAMTPEQQHDYRANTTDKGNKR
ncbi:major facilitator superfamily transporter [Colletotrichum higginsianum]|nr:major facilitator superfamily transporter [Colletotrichum higginsianum]